MRGGFQLSLVMRCSGGISRHQRMIQSTDTIRRRRFLFLVVIIEVISPARHALEFTQANHSTVTLIVVGLIIPVVLLLYLLVDPNVLAASRAELANRKGR